MTTEEHLLTILAEECAEVAQRVSKSLRFGLKEVQPGQPFDNAERICYEFIDLLAVFEMLQDAGVFKTPILSVDGVTGALMDAKKAKVAKFLEFSAARGMVDGRDADPTVPHPEARRDG